MRPGETRTERAVRSPGGTAGRDAEACDHLQLRALGFDGPVPEQQARGARALGKQDPS